MQFRECEGTAAPELQVVWHDGHVSVWPLSFLLLNGFSKCAALARQRAFRPVESTYWTPDALLLKQFDFLQVRNSDCIFGFQFTSIGAAIGLEM